MKFKDITHQRFGRLVVLRRAKNNVHGHPMWNCLCDCGVCTTVSASNLRGKTRSCGCLKRDLVKAKRSLRPYEAIYRMMTRSALHPVDITYDEFVEFCQIEECHYCGAPVKWLKNFVSGQSNGAAYNLDRKDNALGYTKDNCVVCCTRCNVGKSKHFTYDEWKQIGNVIRSWKK